MVFTVVFGKINKNKEKYRKNNKKLLTTQKKCGIIKMKIDVLGESEIPNTSLGSL